MDRNNTNDRTKRGVEYFQIQPVEWAGDIADGGTVPANFKQDAGRDFVVVKVHGTLRSAAGARLTTDPRVFIQTSDTAGNWDQGRVPFEHFAGTAREAAYMSGRMPVIAAGSTVKFTVTNESGAAVRPYITLEGYYRDVAR